MIFLKTIADLQKYVTVSSDMDLKLIQPDLRRAVLHHIVPVIGSELIDALATRFETNYADLTDKEKKAIDYINAAAAPLALWHYAGKGGTTIDGSGLYKRKNENRWNLSDAEQAELKKTFLADGMDALELLVAFLEKNADDYLEYKDSATRTAQQNSLVPSAAVIQEVFQCLHPRLVFHAMREGIRWAESQRIAPILQGYYQALVGHKTPGTAAIDDHLKIARHAVIYLATSRALLTRSVYLTTEGLRVIMDNRAQVSEFENSRIEAVSREYAKTGEADLHSLLQVLSADPPEGFTPETTGTTSAKLKSSPCSKIVFI